MPGNKVWPGLYKHCLETTHIGPVTLLTTLASISRSLLVWMSVEQGEAELVNIFPELKVDCMVSPDTTAIPLLLSRYVTYETVIGEPCLALFV